MDTTDPLDIVRHFAALIQNGRVLTDIHEHAAREMRELEDEIVLVNTGGDGGEDGVVGEAIDIMACALDIVFVHNPQITNEEICSILLRKCEKWARRYKDSIDGDRTIC